MVRRGAYHCPSASSNQSHSQTLDVSTITTYLALGSSSPAPPDLCSQSDASSLVLLPNRHTETLDIITTYLGLGSSSPALPDLCSHSLPCDPAS